VASSLAPRGIHPAHFRVTAIKLRNTLVPKLQLGNPDDEALASRDGKLELPAPNSQAGAWEFAHKVLFSHCLKNLDIPLARTARSTRLTFFLNLMAVTRYVETIKPFFE